MRKRNSRHAGTEIWRSGANTDADSPWQFSFSYDWVMPDTSGDTEPVEEEMLLAEENAYTVQIVLNSTLPMEDDYALANRVADLAYALRHWIYAIIAAAALLVAVCFVFLLCAAGHHPGVEGVRPGWGTKIPLDLLTAAVGLGLFLGIQLVVEAGFWSGIAVILGIVLGSAAGAGVFTGWCMSLALRIKLGGWWRNTVIYVALRWAWKVLKKLGGGLRAAGRGLAGLLGGLGLRGGLLGFQLGDRLVHRFQGGALFLQLGFQVCDAGLDAGQLLIELVLLGVFCRDGGCKIDGGAFRDFDFVLASFGSGHGNIPPVKK